MSKLYQLKVNLNLTVVWKTFDYFYNILRSFVKVHFQNQHGMGTWKNPLVFTCVASQHLILCDITTTTATPRFLKFQNSQPNLY